MTRKSTLSEFVEKAQKIHKNAYDYSKTIYTNNKTKIVIICKKHGEFLCSPTNHLNSRGCPKCKINKLTILHRSNTDEFIDKAYIIHGDIYDYSRTNYIRSSENVIIICKKHGEFKQSPNNHLSGKGCRVCGGSNPLTFEVFINQAKLTHGVKYDYSKVNYKNIDAKVIIICRKHGEFSQSPAAHIIQKQNCPKCSNIISKPELIWLDFLKVSHRQKKLRINDKIINVDGFDEYTNTVYEFYGDYWHGNPKIYKQADIHPLRKCTYGELYTNTLSRERLIRQAGFNLITIWENDWNRNNWTLE